MLELLTSGISNIVCIQPFGCLPNHVVGKGVVKQLKRAYPWANIAAVDYDASASEVNQLNRIKLMLSAAKRSSFFAASQSQEDRPKNQDGHPLKKNTTVVFPSFSCRSPKPSEKGI